MVAETRLYIESRIVRGMPGGTHDVPDPRGGLGSRAYAAAAAASVRCW